VVDGQSDGETSAFDLRMSGSRGHYVKAVKTPIGRGG